MTIDPRDFGRLEAQVQHLMISMAEQTKLMEEINNKLAEQDKLLEQARGGYRALAWLVSAAAALGSIVATTVSWMRGWIT